MNLVNVTVILERRNGQRISVINKSCDDYRMNQMRQREWIQSGELCCRLGIPLIGSEFTELRIVSVG